MVESDHLWQQAFLHRWSDHRPLQRLSSLSWRQEYGLRVRSLLPWRGRDRQLAALKLKFAGEHIRHARVEREGGVWRLRLVSEQALGLAKIEREARFNRSLSFWPRDLQVTVASQNEDGQVAIGFQDGSIRVYAQIPTHVTQTPISIHKGTLPVADLLWSGNDLVSLHQPASQGICHISSWSTAACINLMRGVQWWCLARGSIIYALTNGQIYDGDRLLFTIPPTAELLNLYTQLGWIYCCYRLEDSVSLKAIRGGTVRDISLPNGQLKMVMFPEGPAQLKPSLIVDQQDDLWLMMPEDHGLVQLESPGGSANVTSLWMDASKLVMLRGKKVAIYDACDWHLLMTDSIPPAIRRLSRLSGDLNIQLLQCLEEGQLLVRLSQTLLLLWNFGKSSTSLLPRSTNQNAARRPTTKEARAQLSRAVEDDLDEWHRDREAEAYLDRKREQFNLANLSDRDLIELAKRISLDGHTPEPSRASTPFNTDDDEEYQVRLAMAMSLSQT